ncbi:ABC transporter ATP-binding protein [Microbacterium oleivorans]|uniref:ABC transporter transmembrane region n=1 Tax=Microbacterium oleivorans TaxID=273677 RepID=A0A031FT38_9MICO|nr:ABC transporter ATP-binding protein [Microbacterium oleivorans]EZP27472.1 ABC transporter transmembrane region [Microbacterium oleivorans]
MSLSTRREGKPKRSVLSTARESVAAWRRIAPFFTKSRGKIVLIAVASVVAGLLEAALLTLIAALALALAESREVRIDLIGIGADLSIPLALGLGVALAVLRGVLQLWVAYLPAVMSGQAMVDLRTRLFDAFVGAAWPSKASERDGGFQSVMLNQVRATSETIILIAGVISSGLMFLSLLASAVVMSPPAAAVITVVSLALFAVLRPLARSLRKSSTILSSENIEYAKTTQEVAALAEETEVFGASTAYRERFYSQLRAVQVPFQRVRYLSGAVPALYQSVALLVLVLALGVVALLGAGNVATLGAVVLILVRAVTYGQRVQTSITSVDEKLPFVHHLADAIERYESQPQETGRQSADHIGDLTMSGVGFRYDRGEEVLRDVSFSVKMGEIIGIVGPSGAGKSTLVQLLLRLREPSGGTYSVNGVSASDIDRGDWRRMVTYVPQSPQLFYGSVRENIRFFRDDIDDAAVEDAARRAHIHEDILRLPEGYDTIVGARASLVSGGQRQRITLARALAARPAVMILDEPTSALDVKSEESVQASLQELAGETVVFLVAHRLSTLAICDRVMVVSDGTIAAFDTAENLVVTNSYFSEVSEISGRAATPGLPRRSPRG